ncbi:MAG: NAD(P)-dependent oxidoreductase [Pseudomonadota bacterium]
MLYYPHFLAKHFEFLETDMKNITLLGLGAMGSRMAKKFIEGGHRVTVWNRSSARVEPLANLDATVAESPRSAAKGADFVLSMVRDDRASREVWLNKDTGALDAMEDDAVAIECSTLSVPWVSELAAAFTAAGHSFIDAPLAGSRPQAEAGQLIFFVGAAEDTFKHVEPILDTLAAAVHHVGDTGSGATVKLMVNALFGAQLAVMAELIGFATKMNINVDKAIDVIGSTPVCSPAAKMSAGAMISGAWAPAFPIDLVEKDFQLLNSSADQVAAELPLSTAVGETYAEGVRRGLGEDNITGIVQLYASGTATHK